jgi:hypothetical protein
VAPAGQTTNPAKRTPRLGWFLLSVRDNVLDLPLDHLATFLQSIAKMDRTHE